MDIQSKEKADKEFERACVELNKGHVLSALSHLEKALKIFDNPSWHSFLGFCIAKERGHVTRGMELCRRSMETEPLNSRHNYFLARIYLIDKNKVEAIKILRKGLSHGENTEITKLLDELGSRKPPVFSGLKRDNPVNRITGLLLSRLKAQVNENGEFKASC